MTDFEKKIVRYLAQGYSIVQIAHTLKTQNATPCSISSVEKAIQGLKKKYNANSMFQLGYLINKKEPL